MHQFFSEKNFKAGAQFAAICLAATLPYFFYYLFFGYSDYLEKITPTASKPLLFLSQVVLMYCALLISCVAGYAWSEPGQVKGLGSFLTLKKNLYWIVPLAVIIAVATHFVLQNRFTQNEALYFPQHPLVSLVVPLKNAFFEEPILRFGILTMMFRVARNRYTAIIISAVAGILLGLPYARFFQLNLTIDAELLLLITAKFFSGLIYGYIYCKYGLIPVMSLRFIIALKYLVYSI